MKKFLLLTVSAALLTACGMAANKSDEAANVKSSLAPASEKAAAATPPAVGDQVVARWSGNSWSEGKVDSLSGQRAKVVWSDNSSPSDVDLIDIYQIPKTGAQATVKSGDYVLTKRSSGNDWEGAQVTLVSPGVVTVKYNSDFEEANLPPEKIIAVTPSVAADMKTDAAQTDFMKKAQSHRPQAPAGYQPKVGDHVLGAWTPTAWYGGKVKSISGGKALVVWEGPKPDEATFDNLVPYPTAESTTTPAVGDYVLVKPSGGSWDYAQVSGVSGSGVEVKDREGKTRTVKAGDFAVLK
jgi:hypothetical protein